MLCCIQRLVVRALGNGHPHATGSGETGKRRRISDRQRLWQSRSADTTTGFAAPQQPLLQQAFVDEQRSRAFVDRHGGRTAHDLPDADGRAAHPFHIERDAREQEAVLIRVDHALTAARHPPRPDFGDPEPHHDTQEIAQSILGDGERDHEIEQVVADRRDGDRRRERRRLRFRVEPRLDRRPHRLQPCRLVADRRRTRIDHLDILPQPRDEIAHRVFLGLSRWCFPQLQPEIVGHA